MLFFFSALGVPSAFSFSLSAFTESAERLAMSRGVLLGEAGHELGTNFWLLIWKDAAQLGIQLWLS